MRIAAIPGDAFLKLFVGQEFDQLRKDGAAGIHPPFFPASKERPPKAGFSIQIVPGSKPIHLADYRTLAHASANFSGTAVIHYFASATKIRVFQALESISEVEQATFGCQIENA
ncbi:MAG: hypothetical protein ACRD5Z_15235, partial [Bryobacteraceae bacterium]